MCQRASFNDLCTTDPRRRRRVGSWCSLELRDAWMGALAVLRIALGTISVPVEEGVNA
jgi:hypothetical protein